MGIVKPRPERCWFCGKARGLHPNRECQQWIAPCGSAAAPVASPGSPSESAAPRRPE